MKRFIDFLNETDDQMSSYTVHHPSGTSHKFRFNKGASDDQVKRRAQDIDSRFRFGHPKEFRVERH